MKLYKNPVFLLFIVSFLYMLPSYNKYWAPYDEGNYLVTSYMTLKGMVPYRDFFLVMYPPGQAYALAALFRLFGTSLYVGRIYNIVLLSVICACVFYITRKLTSEKVGLVSFIACLSVLSSLGEPPIPRPIWPGVCASLVSVSLLMTFIENSEARYLVSSGLFLGLTVIFRHDIAFLTAVAGCAGLWAYCLAIAQDKGRALRNKAMRYLGLSTGYLFFPALVTIIFTVWLYEVNALADALRAIFELPASFHRWAAIPFPGFCLDFTRIFHGGCLFIKHNKFYVPILICAAAWLLFLSEVISKRRPDRRLAMLLVLLILSSAYLQQLVFRVDDNHLAVSFAPSAILFGTLFTYGPFIKRQFSSIAKLLLVSYMSLVMALLAYHATERYMKDIFIKPYVRKSVKPVTFKQGTIYIPDDVRDTFVSLANYVTANTNKDDRIYLGHLRHNVPQMGWFELLYFLTERTPAVKYYVMLPGFQNRADVQEEMALSLARNKAKVVLLRDYGEGDATGPLDIYIRRNYKLDRIIGSYHIYVKK